MELYQFVHILRYILCIIEHPDDFSKPRPFWIDLEHENTHVYKFSCLDPNLNLNVPNSLDYNETIAGVIMTSPLSLN